MQPVCRRCLLADMEDQRPLFALIQSYLEAIPEEQKAPEAVYQDRLRLCASCERLASGMCQLCGCYVEVRAVKARLRCPEVPPLW